MIGKLALVEQRYDEIDQLLANPEVSVDSRAVETLAKEQASIRNLVSLSREYRKVRDDLEGVRLMQRDESDQEIVALAQDEMAQLEEQKARVESDLQLALCSGARQPNIDASHCSVSPSDIARRSSADSSSSSPSSFRMHDCSEVVKVSNSFPQSVPASMSYSRIAGAPTCSGVGVGSGVGVSVGSGVGVGTGVDVGRTDVGVGVLVVCIGPGVSGGRTVGVVVGPSSHADSNAAASKHSSPTHTIRHANLPNTPLTRKVNANCLSPSLGRSAASKLVICHVGTIGHAHAE